MDEDHKHRRRGGFRPRGGCGCGCSGFFVVLTLGIILSLLNTDVGVGISARIPFTQSNVTAAGAIGSKEKVADALPDYTRARLGGNQNFINHSQTLTIGPAEGAGLFIVGRQDGAPLIDFHLVTRR